MIKPIYKNLKRSQLVDHYAAEKVSALVNKFPDLRIKDISLTLSMDNSPTQAGRDVFTAQMICRRGRYKGLILKKSTENLYHSLADLFDHTLERLNRMTDRSRVRKVKTARQIKKQCLAKMSA